MNTMFFSGMAFLIVAGLFLCYGTLYDHVIDRERETNGTGYMMIHVFLIFALNNISVSLEFMRETEVALLPKVLFLTGSFVLYFVFLFLTTLYAKERCGFHLKFALLLTAITAVFAALMLVFMRQMIVNIAVSVVFVFVIFALLYLKGRQVPEEGPDHCVEF